MVRVIQRVGGVIIREVIIITKVMLMQGRVKCNLLGRLPRLMIKLTIMPFQEKLRSRHLMPSL